MIKRLDNAQSFLSMLSLLFGLSLGNCGVNSGNPVGTNTTTASIYLKTSTVPSLKSLSIRVSGLQLVNSDQMNRPDEASSEKIIFDSVKVIDLTDVSQGDLVALVENQAITFRDYRQVRLILDPTQAGTAVVSSGETKTVYAVPLDLFVVDQGSPAPKGGRQSDQLAMVSAQSMMSEGTLNRFSIGMEWSQVMVGPQVLSQSLSNYFLQEKGLNQQELDQAMFLQPMQANKTSISPLISFGPSSVGLPLIPLRK